MDDVCGGEKAFVNEPNVSHRDAVIWVTWGWLKWCTPVDGIPGSKFIAEGVGDKSTLDGKHVLTGLCIDNTVLSHEGTPAMAELTAETATTAVLE
jgi:hypothetical protein